MMGIASWNKAQKGYVDIRILFHHHFPFFTKFLHLAVAVESILTSYHLRLNLITNNSPQYSLMHMLPFVQIKEVVNKHSVIPTCTHCLYSYADCSLNLEWFSESSLNECGNAFLCLTNTVETNNITFVVVF